MTVYRGEARDPGRDKRTGRRSRTVGGMSTKTLAEKPMKRIKQLLCALAVHTMIESAQVTRASSQLRAQEELNRRLNDKVNSAAFELKRETSLEVLSVKARTTLGMRPDLYAGTIIVPDRQP